MRDWTYQNPFHLPLELKGWQENSFWGYVYLPSKIPRRKSGHLWKTSWFRGIWATFFTILKFPPHSDVLCSLFQRFIRDKNSASNVYNLLFQRFYIESIIVPWGSSGSTHKYTYGYIIVYVEDKRRRKVWRRLPQQLADSRRRVVVYKSWATFRPALCPTPLVDTNYNHGVELTTLARHRFTTARTFAAHALWIYAHCRTLNGWFTPILQAHGSFQDQ